MTQTNSDYGPIALDFTICHRALKQLDLVARSNSEPVFSRTDSTAQPNESSSRGNPHQKKGSPREFAGVATDSRQVKFGDVFIAYKGVSSDGHDHIESAIRGGAALIIYDDSEYTNIIESLHRQFPCFESIQVKSSRGAWSALCAELYGNPQDKLKFYGVTGTNGKTTTTWMLKEVLTLKGIPSLMIGTIGVYLSGEFRPSHHTTPDPNILYRLFAEALQMGVDTVIMEVSSHSLSQEKLLPIRFDGVAFTSFSRDHMDFHGNMELYYQQKSRLFSREFLKPNSISLICNSIRSPEDTKKDMRLTAEYGTTVYYGVKQPPAGGSTHSPAAESIRRIDGEIKTGRQNVFLGCCQEKNGETNIYISKVSTEYAHLADQDNAKIGGFSSLEQISRTRISPDLCKQKFVLPFLGDFNLENFLAAVVLANNHTALNSEDMASWGSIPQAPGRLALLSVERDDNEKKTGRPSVAIDYAHTPDALKRVLVALRERFQNVLLVFGCGGDRDQGKRREMGAVALGLASRIFVTTDNPRFEDPLTIISQICAGFSSMVNVKIVPDRETAIAKAISCGNLGDVVLIAGKGHENYQIIGANRHDFDDTKVARKYLLAETKAVTRIKAKTNGKKNGCKDTVQTLAWSDWFSHCCVGTIPDELELPHPNSITIDSRSIEEGDWFCPIIGERFDGHKFIADAHKRSGGGFFYQSSHRHLVPNHLLNFGVEVHDTLDTLQTIAKNWRLQQEDLTVFAITGSVGKTTTKYMLGEILQHLGKTNIPEGNFNNEIGVPLSLLKLRPDHRYCILEFGARHLGDIKLLSTIGTPDIVCLLNAGSGHIGEFGSRENICNAKLEIIRDSQNHAVCVFDADDARIVSAIDQMKGLASREPWHTRRFIGVSTSNEQGDVQVLGHHRLDSGGMDVDFRFDRRLFEMKQDLLDPTCQEKLDHQQGAASRAPKQGERKADDSIFCTASLGLFHLAYPVNAAATLAMVLGAGLRPPSIKDCLQGFDGVGGRYKMRKYPHLIVIDDCYNANPESLTAGLASLRAGFHNFRHILILGDMLELGVKSEEMHQGIGRELFQNYKERVEGKGDLSHIYTVGIESHLISEEYTSFSCVHDRTKQYDTPDEFPNDRDASEVKHTHLKSVDDLIDHFDSTGFGFLFKKSKGGVPDKAGEGVPAQHNTVIYIKGSNGIHLNKFVQYLDQAVAANEHG